MAKLRYERSIPLLALVAGLPGTVLGLILLWTGDFSAKLQWTLTSLVVVAFAAALFALRERLVGPLQTLSNLVAAIREGDYTLRVRGARHDDVLGLLQLELNTLGEDLKQQRLRAMEARGLLQRVMDETDVTILAFDGESKLRMINQAGERMLQRRRDELMGRAADTIGLERCLSEPPGLLELAFAGRVGRWDIRRTTFRQEGSPYQLVVLADLSRTLREEERNAWQKLIRVLGHEINNSLAPIQSLAQSLLARDARGERESESMREGLEVIAGRSASLSRFMASYSRLAQLPTPQRATIDLGPYLDRVVGLHPTEIVTLEGGPPMTVHADPDQLEQLLINLIDNAVDAVQETGGAVRVSWTNGREGVEIRVEDDGPGLADTANLFVPFFTTKPKGSGIGLVLSRQIAELHGGTVTLANRANGTGCVARVALPKASA